MSVTSSLSEDQRRKLLSLLGHARLCLLYKASVHGYAAASFHNRCDLQGPTVVVAFNQSGFVFGAYTSKNYAQTGQHVNDDQAFLFSINDERVKPLRVASADGLYGFLDAGNYGPYFGALVFNGTATVQSQPGTNYNFDPAQMHGNDLQLRECEVYRVEDCGGLLEMPWRAVNWDSVERRKELKDYVQTYKPDINSVSQARILLVGPVGAGKSSFFNSINSVFRGNLTGQAATGTANTSLTTQFRTYSIKAGRGGKPLPLVLCDTMGLEEELNAGLDVEDITSILKGHVPDRHQFNPLGSLSSDDDRFCKSTGLKNRIHCVVFVVDACKVKLLSAKMVDKFAAIRKKVNKMSVPQLVLLTKVDEACPWVKKDVTNVYLSHYIERMVCEASVCLGVSQSVVLPVKSYCREVELDLNTDILLLSALVQMLHFTDCYFDDLHEEGGEKCD